MSKDEWTQKLEEYIDANVDTLRKDYEQYIDEMQDSISHKSYMLNSDACFEEWCAEQMESKSYMGTLKTADVMAVFDSMFAGPSIPGIERKLK